LEPQKMIRNASLITFLVAKSTEYIGRKVKMNEVSYGSLEPFILFNGFRKKDLIAKCSLY